MVARAIHSFIINIEIVTTDAMQSGCSTCIDTRMTDGRDGRQIVDQAVVATVALADEPFETIIAKLVIIPGEIIPAHLVYHDSHYKFRTLVKIRMRLHRLASTHHHQTYK